MKYSKKFTNQADYESYIASQDFITPNVDICVIEDQGIKDYYHKAPVKYLKCIYDVSTTAVNTVLMDNTHYNSLSSINKMYIDDVEVTKVASYKFNTLGKHKVEYDIQVGATDGNLLMSFNGCKALEEVTIPDKCRSFHSNSSTFQDCNKLRRLYNLHKDFNPIPYLTGDDFCFSELEYIHIDPRNPYVDSRRKSNAIINKNTHTLLIGSSHTNIIPGDVSVIEYCAFQGRHELTGHLEIPDNVKVIETNAFATTSLTSVYVHKGCRSIGRSAFLDASRITSIVLEDGLGGIEDYAFQRTGITGDLYIPGSIQYIYPILLNKTNVNSLKIGEGVTILYYAALNGVTQLESLDLPSTITQVGQQCTKYPSYADSRGYAFAWCPNLKSITIRATTPPTLYGNTSYGGIDSNFLAKTYEQSGGATTYEFLFPTCKLYVPAGSVTAYRNAAGWAQFGANILPITE